MVHISSSSTLPSTITNHPPHNFIRRTDYCLPLNACPYLSRRKPSKRLNGLDLHRGSDQILFCDSLSRSLEPLGLEVGIHCSLVFVLKNMSVRATESNQPFRLTAFFCIKNECAILLDLLKELKHELRSLLIRQSQE